MSWVVCTRLISLRSPIFINAGMKLSCSLKASLYCIPQKHNVAQNSSSASLSVPEMFRRDQIVPDIIATPPPVLAKVVYNPDVECDCGTILTPTQVQDPPSVTWPSEKGALYTLLMTDPDAPSRIDPKFREFRHWLVMNIPECDVERGEEVETYIGSGPPKSTGLHRFVFLVYKQSGRILYTDHRLGFSTTGRTYTKVRHLEKKYGLGIPIAGNYYQAMWDEFVLKLYEKLGGSLF